MTLPNIIALYSPCPHSGKSTVAHLLTQKYGYMALKLAGPLKRMLGQLLDEMGICGTDMIHAHLEGPLKEKNIPGYGISPRYLMQTLGTEWGQHLVFKEFWVKILFSQIEKWEKLGQTKFVIDDMRFPHEYTALKNNGALMINVVRDQAGPSYGHSSEGSLNGYPFDATVINKGTKEELRETVAVLLDAYMDKRLTCNTK